MSSRPKQQRTVPSAMEQKEPSFTRVPVASMTIRFINIINEFEIPVGEDIDILLSNPAMNKDKDMLLSLHKGLMRAAGRIVQRISEVANVTPVAEGTEGGEAKEGMQPAAPAQPARPLIIPARAGMVPR